MQPVLGHRKKTHSFSGLALRQSSRGRRRLEYLHPVDYALCWHDPHHHLCQRPVSRAYYLTRAKEM